MNAYLVTHNKQDTLWSIHLLTRQLSIITHLRAVSHMHWKNNKICSKTSQKCVHWKAQNHVFGFTTQTVLLITL